MAFVDVLSGFMLDNGIGDGAYVASGVSLQNGVRRETGAETIVLLRQTGGTALQGASPGRSDSSNDWGFQVLVDSETASGARATAESIFELLHAAQDASVISGYKVLWLRAVAPPQDVGPGPGPAKRFAVSTNYTARLVR